MEKPINCFPGYEYIPPTKTGERAKNMYRGVDLGMGGYVYGEPGIYRDVALLDIQSLHPNSAVNLNYFGKYTPRFKEILDARIAIKNREFDKARKMFDGKIAKYLDDESTADQLATALKIVINSVYGLSSASFENPFRDKRNKNNIVALRGALFMKTLQDEVVAKGYRVVAVRTDSIKIPNATIDIIQFCMSFAKKYGYTFEHEATYERMCLVDNAQYIAAYKDPEECKALYGYIPKDNAKQFKKYSHPWTATGKEFQRPIIFKTLFSGEEPTFDDYCETCSTTVGDIYLDINEGFPNVETEEKEMDKRRYNAAYPDKTPQKLSPAFTDISDEDLKLMIAKGHDYRFVGRVGRFYPVKPGCRGGWLVALRNGKYGSVTGTKGYRWLEAEMIKELHKEGDLDPRYHNAQVTEAIEAINKFGSYERFVDLSKPYEVPSPAPIDIQQEEEDDELPFDLVPCGDGKYNTCMECPNCVGDICRRGYSLNSFVEKGGDANGLG